MDQQEIAPPYESWTDHLKALGNKELSELARDYRWLDEESRSEEQPEFRKRREAVIAECERRGMAGVAQSCRQPVG
jgi:hypothetical protein